MSLLTPDQVCAKLPITAVQQAKVAAYRETLQNLICGKDRRLALAVGPCSIHDLSSVLEYGRRFRTLADEVAASCFCVMRVYIEKPRTAAGWKGLVYDPHLDGSNDVQTGIFWARELFLTLTDLGIPIATELLHPLLVPFFSDLISWGFIGARTSASQPHRELASSLPFPIGFKNSPEGSVLQAVQAMVSARGPHRFPCMNRHGQLALAEGPGNPSTHIVLRGSLTGPNYSRTQMAETAALLTAHGMKQRILVDCSHGNSQKQFPLQQHVFQDVLEQAKENDAILGMMLESHLEEGSQPLMESPSALHYGVSVTDACLGWKETAALMRQSSGLLTR